jgi:hypothetical protein
LLNRRRFGFTAFVCLVGPRGEPEKVPDPFSQDLTDADAAAAKLDAHLDSSATSGGSTANTCHWIHALQALGHVDAKVTADIPTFAVFDKAGKKTHAAWNPTDKPAMVTFSDGVKPAVPPGAVLAEPFAR